MGIGSFTAKRGFKDEEIFTNLINNNPSFNNHVKSYLGAAGILKATNVKGTGKPDVILHVNNVDVGCSIKSAKADFNQLDRRWLSSLVSALDMPDEIAGYLQEGLDSMRLKLSGGRLVLPRYASKIVQYFNANYRRLLVELFTRGDDSLKLFIGYNNVNKVWYICKMEEIINFILSQPISVSPNGVLYFGNYLSLQRKGGDGNITIPPKSDPRHPGNQLQFKIKPLGIVNAIGTVFTIYPT